MQMNVRGSKRMKNITFENIDITGGFWKTKQDMVKDTTLFAVYDRFCETYRFDALNCNWTEKDGEERKPHIFWDSDTAKWIEGASYILSKQRDEKIEKIIDDAVDKIVENADENGYFNSHFLTQRPEAKFTIRYAHELYCLGHLIEAAIAYKNATGKDKLLCAMCRYADYVDKAFRVEKSAGFTTPGHPELELALVKLYEATGNRRYLDLASFFIDNHGCSDKSLDKKGTRFAPMYNMDDMPLRQRTTIDGHSVRALYLLSGAADVAKHTNDAELFEMCRRLFDNCTKRRMYITGGVGSTYLGESFTSDFHLPARKAYTETCAAIALVLFARRMQALDKDSKYADIAEKVIYNGFLSGISLDGKSFFYENPLEIDPDFNYIYNATEEKERFPAILRQQIFSCSCCPPNIVRFIPSIADGMYSLDGDILYVHQFMESRGSFDGVTAVQTTNYPCDGNVKITVSGCKKAAIRIPSWCKSFTVSLPYVMEKGYAVVDCTEGEASIDICFDMPVVLMRAHNRVHDVSGRAAVMRGPVVYCLESVDNGADLRNICLDRKGEFTLGEGEFLLPSIMAQGTRDVETDELYSVYDGEKRQCSLKFIPYYAFANRGISEMLVWVQ